MSKRDFYEVLGVFGNAEDLKKIAFGHVAGPLVVGLD